MQGNLFVVSAPSGAGKTSLVREILSRLQKKIPLALVVTFTTKPPRKGEMPGIDYHFISIKEFQAKIAQGFFMEWSTAYGHYYGSPRSIIEHIASGSSYIIIVDRQGAQAIADCYARSILIWIYTDSLDVLTQRLIARGSENNEQITRRIELARVELEEEKRNPIFKYYIKNDDFSRASTQFQEIILTYIV